MTSWGWLSAASVPRDVCVPHSSIERAARSGRKAGNGGSCGFGVRTDVTGALFVNKCCTSVILVGPNSVVAWSVAYNMPSWQQNTPTV
jgi:hypothetical protein